MRKNSFKSKFGNLHDDDFTRFTPKRVPNDYIFEGEDGGEEVSTKPSNTSAPQTSLGVEPPQYNLPDGSINPRYRSGRGASALAGGKIGFGLRNGDPMFDAGVTLGGVIGGALNKDLAGKMQYLEEVAMSNRQNETTQAHQRLLAQAEQIRINAEKEKRAAEKQNFDIKMKEALTKVKTQGDMSRFLIDAAKMTTDPEQKAQIHQKFMATWGIEGDPNEEFGNVYETKVFGDFAFLFDKNTGELKNAKGQDGQPISALSTPQQINALGAWMKLGDKDTPTLEEGLAKADEYITKNFKGGLKPQQYNSLKMQLAKQIISNKESGSTTGKVIVDGNIIPTPDLPIFGQKPPAPAANTGSQFMPVEEGGVIKVPIYDATVGEKPLVQPPTQKLPEGVKPNVKYLQKDGSYLMFDGKGWVRFKKK